LIGALDVATQKSSVISPVLDLARRTANKVIQDTADVSVLDVLGSKMSLLKIVYPGDLEAYHQTATVLEEKAAEVCAALYEVDHFKIAAMELHWRIFEMHCSGLSLDGIVKELEQRAVSLLSPWRIFEECYLHRYSISQSISNTTPPPGGWDSQPGSLGKPVLTTDSEICAKIIVDKSILTEDEDQQMQESGIEEIVAFSLFDSLLKDYAGDLSDVSAAKRVTSTMDKHGNELKQFRERVHESARHLMKSGVTSSSESAYKDVLNTLVKDVRAIADLDKSKSRELYERLTEDSTLWLTISGFLGGVIGSMPALSMPMAAAVAAAKVGTEALKLSRGKRKVLRDSPWSFVYHVKKR
jgi:hypothetical protein